VPVPSSLAPLRHRRFALIWSGAFASNVGTWMETIGVGILVTTTTGQASWTGVVAAAGFVPNAVLGPFGGALADRLHRRTLLAVTTTVQLLLAGVLTLLAASGTPGPLLVTMIVLASGCAGALGFPAYQAILPDLVPREELTSAVALSAAQFNLGRVIGPALAGIVIAIGGYAWAFGVNMLSFLFVLGALALVRLPAPAAPPTEGIFRSIGTGFRFARADPGIRTAFTLLALNSFLAAPFIALVPAVALKVFGDETRGTAVLVTAQGLGAVTMALVIGALTVRMGRRRTLFTVFAATQVSLLVYAGAPTLAIGAVTIFVVGFWYLGALSSSTTVAQLRAPAALRGRVVSVAMLILGSMYPLGAVTQGWVADRIGLRATTAGAAVLMLIVMGVAYLIRPDAGRDIDDEIVVESTP